MNSNLIVNLVDLAIALAQSQLDSRRREAGVARDCPERGSSVRGPYRRAARSVADQSGRAGMNAAVISKIADAIAFAEGYFVSGSRPHRNNNPGDLERDLTRQGRRMGWTLCRFTAPCRMDARRSSTRCG